MRRVGGCTKVTNQLAKMMLKTVLISSAALALAASAESKPAAPEQVPAPVAVEEKKALEDPTKGLQGKKLREWIEDEFDADTEPAVLSALVAVCPHLNRAEVERVPHFIHHINSECFASLLKHEDKAVLRMLLKIDTKEAAESLVARVGEPLLSIPEERLTGHPVPLQDAIKAAKKVKAESTEAKEVPKKDNSAAASSVSAVIAVLGVAAMLC